MNVSFWLSGPTSQGMRFKRCVEAEKGQAGSLPYMGLIRDK